MLRFAGLLLMASTSAHAQPAGKRDGRPLWTVTVPANGTRTLRDRFRPGA